MNVFETKYFFRFFFKHKDIGKTNTNCMSLMMDIIAKKKNRKETSYCAVASFWTVSVFDVDSDRKTMEQKTKKSVINHFYDTQMTGKFGARFCIISFKFFILASLPFSYKYICIEIIIEKKITKNKPTDSTLRTTDKIIMDY